MTRCLIKVLFKVYLANMELDEMNLKITCDYVIKLLDYNPITGTLKWRERTSDMFVKGDSWLSMIERKLLSFGEMQ